MKPIQDYYAQATALLDHLHGYHLDLASGESAMIFEHDRNLAAAQFQAADARALAIAKIDILRGACTCPPLESLRRTLHHPGCPCIESDPDRCGGNPVISGTRVTVSQVLAELAEGHSISELAEDLALDRTKLSEALLAISMHLRHPV